jgi:hypothetical protein
MTKEKINKIAVSGINTKSVSMDNFVCAPFIHGLFAKDYVSLT